MNQHTSLFQTDVTPEEFAQRRARVFEKILPNALVVLQASQPTGEFDRFRQAREFFYLCGVEVPHAYLMLDGRNRKTSLYLPEHNPQQERSEGPVLNSSDPESVAKLTGVDEVRKPEALAHDVLGATTIYTLLGRTNQNDADPLGGLPTPDTHLTERLKELCPGVKVLDLLPVTNPLRMVKSPAELRLMRQAGRLTALAVAECMRSTMPGVMEYQLGAIADYIYLVNGARGAGYRAIIAGGANAWHGHYFRNNCALLDGDLVLMDYAPDCGGYTSDIGRMWPVNGKYAPWQRELYGFIVEYHKALLQRIQPGALAADILWGAADAMRPIIKATKFSKPCYEEAAQRMLDFRGHLSHTVGLSVHDAGPYWDTPLVPGIVFSVDPQMWIPEEQLYIRTEDTVAVTETGIENLTDIAPLEIDDVEALMKEEGMLTRFGLGG